MLVDMDMRRPMVGMFFGAADVPDLTELLLARALPSEVLTDIPVMPEDDDESILVRYSDKGHPGPDNQKGRLQIVTCRQGLPRPADLMSSKRVAEVLAQLQKGADVVIIDSAPLLPVSDTLELATHVDGIVIVARANLVRRRMVTEVGRLVDSLPCAKLGFIVTNAEAEDDYGSYGYTYSDVGQNGNGTTAGIRSRIAHMAPSARNLVRRRSVDRT